MALGLSSLIFSSPSFSALSGFDLQHLHSLAKHDDSALEVLALLFSIFLLVMRPDGVARVAEVGEVFAVLSFKCMSISTLASSSLIFFTFCSDTSVSASDVQLGVRVFLFSPVNTDVVVRVSSYFAATGGGR